MKNNHHLNIIILAAGQGTRMKSKLPKVLHQLAGVALLQHVINTSKELKAGMINVIYGHGGQKVKDAVNEKINWIEQKEQLGTGHAVAQAKATLDDDQLVLVLYGDVPLTRVDTLAELIRQAEDGLALLTVHLNNPQGYGRIVRDQNGKVLNITEEKDATDQVKKIREVNTGILAVNGKLLKGWLERLNNNNAQNEYYLTDIIEMAVKDGLPVKTTQPDNEFEVMGVNNRIQLSELERYHQNEVATRLMTNGVTLADPSRLDVRGKLECGSDSFIDVNNVFEGNVNIGDRVSIGANCVIKNCEIGNDVEILPMTVIEDASIQSGSRIGPFARLRPGTKLDENTHIGNFVEIKNSHIGVGSKVNHLSYIGDTTMGSGVNIGAGTITANYDGANKHHTDIENNASTGSNSVLIAPVKVGEGATLGAGTVLASDAPEGELTITRVKQKTITGWKRPVKDKK